METATLTQAISHFLTNGGKMKELIRIARNVRRTIRTTQTNNPEPETIQRLKLRIVRAKRRLKALRQNYRNLRERTKRAYEKVKKQREYIQRLEARLTELTA